MTLILLRFFLKKIQLECSNCHYYFLLLIFMFYSKSTTSQVVSDFTTINLNTGCGSLVVEFEDLSTGNPDTWLWDFGNGNSSSQQNPIAVYSSPGIYTVKLTVSDASTQDVHIQTDFVKRVTGQKIKAFLLPSKCHAFSEEKTASFSEPTKTSCPREMLFPARSVLW